MFLEGLKIHGKGWKQIAQMIKTRTVVQIRTHAQKYFQKLSKVRVPEGGGELHDLVPQRTPSRCRRRRHHHHHHYHHPPR